MNCIPKVNQEKSPHELFTGKEVDYLRDFRAEWGEPIIVKKPKGVTSDLRVTGKWGVVVRRIMNGTGVLKVYLVQSRKYAYRLQFRCAKAPFWVLESLEDMSKNNMTIGFEEYPEMPMPLEPNENENVTQDIAQSPVIDTNDTDEAEIYKDSNTEPMVVMRAVDTIEEVLDMADENKQDHLSEVVEQNAEEPAEPSRVTHVEAYRTRSGRVIKPPERYGFEKALATVKEWYKVEHGHRY
jgi:hypothetical protein